MGRGCGTCYAGCLVLRVSQVVIHSMTAINDFGKCAEVRHHTDKEGETKFYECKPGRCQTSSNICKSLTRTNTTPPPQPKPRCEIVHCPITQETKLIYHPSSPTLSSKLKRKRATSRFTHVTHNHYSTTTTRRPSIEQSRMHQEKPVKMREAI